MATWGLVFLSGLGVFIIVYFCLSWIVDGVIWLVSRRRRRYAKLMNYLATGQKNVQEYKATQSDLLGLGHIPWLQVDILSVVFVLGLYLFTGQFVILFYAFVPFAIRAWLVRYRKHQLDTEVMAFLMDVRIALPLQGSLLRALQYVSQQSETRLAKITERYLAGFQGNGLDLLNRLAQDTGLSPLIDLVAWAHAAEEGTLKSDVPFEHALERLRAEMYTTIREQMQRIPTRLTVLVLPALLGPVIVLLVYPMVARLLAGLSNIGWNGGF